MNLEEKIKLIMVKVFDVSKDDIIEDFSADTCHTWDSLGHVNLMLALEQDLGIEFDEDQIVELNSYKKILNYFLHCK